MKSFFLSIGVRDGISAGAIVRFICDTANIRSSSLGLIDIKSKFSFFEVEASMAEKVMSSLHGAKIDGKEVRIGKAGRRPPQKAGTSRPTRK